MALIKDITELSQTTGEVTDTTYGTAISVVGALTYSAQCVVVVDTPAAKTFNSGVAASKVIQDLTYTAVTRGAAGNSITIAYTGGGVAGAEIVTVVGTAISIQIQSGVSTATQVNTAYGLSAPAIALATAVVSGTGGNAQTTVSATPLASGVDSAVDISADTVTIAANGLTTGVKGQLTTTGTLPAGLSLSTDYFIISIDANTVAFATSLANAEAGTKVNITGQGASGSVNTFTSTSISGASVILQESNDPSNYLPSEVVDWTDLGSASNITQTANLVLKKVNPESNWIRLKFVITAGRFASTNYIVVKGPN